MKAYLKHTSCGRPLVKFPKHPPQPLPLSSPVVEPTQWEPLRHTKFRHTSSNPIQTDFQKKNQVGKVNFPK